MGELTVRTESLPDTLEELITYCNVANEAVKASLAKVRALKHLTSEEAMQQRDKVLSIAQDQAINYIDAEAKLGGLVAGIPNKKAPSGSGRCSLPPGLSHKHSHIAQAIHRHRDIADKAIAEIIVKEDIPSRGKVYSAIKAYLREQDIAGQRSDIESGIPNPEGPFDVVILDPPWPYGRKYNPEASRAANPYPEMSIEAIVTDAKEINFKPDAVLWLWTTHQFIWDAKSIMDAVEFDYKATLVWNKDKMGLGAWLRMQCEFCLLGIRGKPFFDGSSARDIITEKGREHSRKPNAFYDLVMTVSPGNICDRFSREQRDGIVSGGNDVRRFNG